MRNYISIYFNRFLLVFVGYFCSIATTVHAEVTYTWSVVPQFTGIAVHRDWTPLLKAIEKDTGYQFALKLYSSISSFEKGFFDGEPDFAYMNPYHAVMAKRAQGYTPIIRDGKKKLTGILVTRKDSSINNIQDLNGKEIAFPSPNAFAASLYIRALLIEQENIKFTPVYAKTHSNSYRYVLGHKAPASGGVYRTLKRERAEAQSYLQVIYKTPSSASHPIVVHKRVPNDVAIAVQNSIISLIKTAEGKKILNAILIPHPTPATYQADYKPLENLKLEKYTLKHSK